MLSVQKSPENKISFLECKKVSFSGVHTMVLACFSLIMFRPVFGSHTSRNPFKIVHYKVFLYIQDTMD